MILEAAMTVALVAGGPVSDENNYVPQPLQEQALIQQAVSEGVTEPYVVPEPWHSLAMCEASKDGVIYWDYDGSNYSWGNGLFDGGLQFHPRTWTAFGGGQYAEYAWQATPEQQVHIAQHVQAAQGWGAWPSCSKKIGLR